MDFVHKDLATIQASKTSSAKFETARSLAEKGLADFDGGNHRFSVVASPMKARGRLTGYMD
jgi:hypothetical protein